VKDTRMKDREVILRYLAFRWFDYQNLYSGDMSSYVEMAMKKINRMNETELKDIKADFERVIKWSYEIWKEKNFRIPTSQTKGTINMAIFETVNYYLSQRDNDFLKRNKSKIKSNYISLYSNKNFYEAVTNSTSNKAKVLDRFRLVFEFLDKETI